MSKTKTDDKSKLESKLKTATGSDSEIIDGLIAAIAENKAKVEVKPVTIEPKKQHPLLGYYYRGRTINQLAGMFLITEAEVRKIIEENENI
jgi:hypothetical protein